MKVYFNKEHKKLVASIVENFLNDSKQESYSKNHIRTSEAELSELIKFSSNAIIEKIESALDVKSKVVQMNQLGLSLFLIGETLHKSISDELKSYQTTVKDPLMSFMDENTIYHHCIEDLFGEPFDNFMEEDELKSLRRYYQNSIKPKIYDSYSRFEWVTPFHYNNVSIGGEKVYFSFQKYVNFWMSNSELNTVVKDFRSKNSKNEERWLWYGKYHDFYELEKILVEYRSNNHEFLKEIFTLEHVFIFNVYQDYKLGLTEVEAILDECINSFIYSFVESFFSEEASLRASKVVREILSEQIKRENDWKEYERKRIEQEEKRKIEIMNKSVQREQESIKSELVLLISITKCVIAMSLFALLPLPYDFYRILRVCLFGFSIFAFLKISLVFERELIHQQMLRVTFAITGIIFNPVIPVHLKKETWIFINIIFSLICFYLIKYAKKRSET